MGMKTIIERAFTQKAQEKLSAQDEYKQIVTSDKLTDADERRLYEIIHQLGISKEQANADVDAVAKMISLKALASTADARMKLRNKANAAHLQACEDRQKQFAAMNALVHAAMMNMDQTFEDFQQASKAPRLIEELAAANPHLF